MAHEIGINEAMQHAARGERRCDVCDDDVVVMWPSR